MSKNFIPPISSEEELKEAMEKGEHKFITDDHLELSVYTYKNKVYIYDVKEVS